MLKDAVDQLIDVTRAIYDTALTPQTVTDVVNKRTLINKTQYNRSRGLGGI